MTLDEHLARMAASAAMLAKKVGILPKARSSSGRNKMSMAVVIFGQNHITSTSANTAIPRLASITSAGFSAKTAISVPTTSNPIQAGELTNIKIAKASW
jgi:hypothetical protein